MKHILKERYVVSGFEQNVSFQGFGVVVSFVLLFFTISVLAGELCVPVFSLRQASISIAMVKNLKNVLSLCLCFDLTKFKTYYSTKHCNNSSAYYLIKSIRLFYQCMED